MRWQDRADDNVQSSSGACKRPREQPYATARHEEHLQRSCVRINGKHEPQSPVLIHRNVNVLTGVWRAAGDCRDLFLRW